MDYCETHAKVVSVELKKKIAQKRRSISSQIVVYVFPISVNFFNSIL